MQNIFIHSITNNKYHDVPHHNKLTPKSEFSFILDLLEKEKKKSQINVPFPIASYNYSIKIDINKNDTTLSNKPGLIKQIDNLIDLIINKSEILCSNKLKIEFQMGLLYSIIFEITLLDINYISINIFIDCKVAPEIINNFIKSLINKLNKKGIGLKSVEIQHNNCNDNKPLPVKSLNL